MSVIFLDEDEPELYVPENGLWTPSDDDYILLDKELVFENCGYKPHINQNKIHESAARHRVAACGRRFGKSRAGGMELVPDALETFANADLMRQLDLQHYYWIVGPNYDDAEKEWRVLYNTARKLGLPFDKPGTYNDTEGGNMRMSLWGGLYIVECKSAAHPDSLVGEGLSGVLMVEAAKMKPSVWTKYIRPALADKRGWSLFGSTPEGKNWFYDLWRRGQDILDESWDSWRMPSWFNTIIFPGGQTDPEIIDMGKDMSQDKFEQEIGASFTESVGLVFKDFDEEIHVGHYPFDPTLPLYGACDYGWTNPTVWLLIQVNVWGDVFVIGEHRWIHTDIEDIGKDLVEWRGGLSKRIRRFYPDPASPGDSAVLEKYLHAKSDPNTGGELKWRLELIRQRLKLGPDHAPEEIKKPKLFIDRSCTVPGPDGMSGIDEMLAYKWPETKEESLRAEPEKPVSKNDHFPEALGRFFRGYFGAPAEESTHVRVRRGNMSRGRAVRR